MSISLFVLLDDLSTKPFDEAKCIVFDKNQQVVRSNILVRPFEKSIWRQHMDKYIDVKSQGEVQRCTFFSGGILYAGFFAYKNSLKWLAADINKGVSLPINEIAYNCDGVRLFFELDYRCKQQLPDSTTIDKHLKIIRQVVADMFTCEFVMHVAMCQPKLKTNKSGESCLAFGLHVVFNGIVCYTALIKRCGELIDTKITEDDPVWAGVVDTGSVHHKHASLRMIYACKIEQCQFCNKYNYNTSSFSGNITSGNYSTKKMKKRRKVWNEKSRNVESLDGFLSDNEFDEKEDIGLEFEAEADEMCYIHDKPLLLALYDCDQCVNGVSQNTSIYTPMMSFNKDGQVDYGIQTAPILHQLLWMSINPMTEGPGRFTTNIRIPQDMPNILDSRPIGNILYKQERQIISRSKSYNTLQVIKYADIYRKMTSVIRELLPQMRCVLIANIRFNVDKKSLYIDLRSTGSRYCPLHGGEHTSNRVYFVLMICSGQIFLNCYNKECRDVLKHTEEKNIFQLDAGIKQDLCLILDIPLKSKVSHVNLRGNKTSVVEVQTKPTPPISEVQLCTKNIWVDIDIATIPDNLDL